MCFGATPTPSNKSAEKAAEQARVDEANRTGNLISGSQKINSAFGGYDDSYYDGLKKNYTDFYNPQLEDQYGKSKESALFNAARSGNIQSSANSRTNADLEKEYGTQKQSILSGAESYANQARNQIANQKAAAQSNLSATGGAYVDGTGLGQVAAPTLNPLSPLGDLFGNVAGVVANDNLVRARQAGLASVTGGQQKPTSGANNAAVWVN